MARLGRLRFHQRGQRIQIRHRDLLFMTANTLRYAGMIFMVRGISARL